MNLSALSIRYPVPAVLLFILLTLFGWLGFERLPIQDFPDMDLPVVNITASLEGAAPEQLETEVARKLEDKLTSLRLLKHVTTVITDGAVLISVTFEIDKDGNEAVMEVRNAVDSARPELPANLDAPSISRLTTSALPLLSYVVEAPGLDDEQLSWFIDNDMAKRLLSVPGIAQIARSGGVDREIQVDLAPALMAGLGVSVTDVDSALRAVQKDNSGGQGNLGSGQQAVRTLGAIDDPAALGRLAIPGSDGRRLPLSQLATIHDGHAERTSLAFLDGKPVIGVQLTRSLGYSDVQVAQGAREAMASFQAQHPQVKITEVSDTVRPILANYHDSLHLLYEGMLLAVIVVGLFLRDWRATLIVATALPLSILPTFGVMYLAGFTLNVLSLLALALVIGVLVDDAIVEIENIARHMRDGKPPPQAASEAAGEIGLAVLATTLTLVAVFLPTAFMGGVVGKLFRQFGVTASVALLFSLLVARVLTPMMAAYFLKAPKASGPERDGRLMTRYLGWIHQTLTHRRATLLAATVFFIGTLALIPQLSTSFLPPQDSGTSKVILELPPGTTLEHTAEVTREADKRLRAIPEVVRVFSLVGSARSSASGAANITGAGDAILTVELLPRDQRSITQGAVESKMRDALRSLPGVRVDVGGNGSGEKLNLVLASDDGELLERTAQALEPQMRQIPGIGAVSSSSALQRPEIQMRPNPARAAALGVTSQAIADTLRMATYGQYSSQLGKINLAQRQVDVRVRMDPAVRTDLGLIGQLRVPGNDGQIALASLGELSMGSGPAQITRLDRLRNITLSVELNGRNLGDVMAQVKQLPAMQHLPEQVKIVEQGELQLMTELFASFGLALAIGVLCVYAVLVLLFHDFLQPATILSALPLSLGGALVALIVCGMSFSLPAVIGFLMLMGIVTKNSILLVEYAIVARRELGMSRYDALIDACHKRARPIIMTTVAMGGGMLPTALGFGEDPSFRQPMAVIVMGGLLASTVLSLLVVPVIFTRVDDMLQCLKRRMGRS